MLVSHARVLLVASMAPIRSPDVSMIDPRDRPVWRQRYRRLLPFEETRAIVRRMGIDSKNEFRERRWGPYIPSQPDLVPRHVESDRHQRRGG